MEPTQDKNSPETGFTDEFLSHAFTPRNVGVMTDPDGYGAPKGACGDTVEIYLKVHAGLIDQALFLTDGCAHTIACASVVTSLAQGRTVEETQAISPEEVIEALGGLPEDHVHCARLAVTTMRLAVKNYLKNVDQAWKRPYRKSFRDS